MALIQGRVSAITFSYMNTICHTTLVVVLVSIGFFLGFGCRFTDAGGSVITQYIVAPIGVLFITMFAIKWLMDRVDEGDKKIKDLEEKLEAEKSTKK